MDCPTVSIIIPTCNGRLHLEECFRSLSALDYPRDRREIIVVDNGSLDDSVAYLTAQYPETIIVRNARNLGFAAACNLGAERKRLLERNGLFTIFKDYSGEALERTLLPAMSSVAKRAAVDRADSAVALEAIVGFVASREELRRKRQAVQNRRKVGDGEILPLFRQPFRPSMHDEGQP